MDVGLELTVPNAATLEINSNFVVTKQNIMGPNAGIRFVAWFSRTNVPFAKFYLYKDSAWGF